MKFDFWFDLPKALENICKDMLTKEELDSINFIDRASKVKIKNKFYFKQEIVKYYEIFTLNYEKISPNLSREDLEKIDVKLKNILKEQTELVCSYIKLSLKIMSKLLKYISDNNSQNENEGINNKNGDYFINDLLTKTKLFLKISRLVIENAKKYIETKTEKVKEFFSM